MRTSAVSGNSFFGKNASTPLPVPSNGLTIRPPLHSIVPVHVRVWPDSFSGILCVLFPRHGNEAALDISLQTSLVSCRSRHLAALAYCILKRTGPPFAAMSSDAPCGYSRPGGRVRVRGNSTPSAAGVFLETGTTGSPVRILRLKEYRQACAACRASYAVGASRGCPLTTFTPMIVPVVCVPTAVTRTLTNRLPPT